MTDEIVLNKWLDIQISQELSVRVLSQRATKPNGESYQLNMYEQMGKVIYPTMNKRIGLCSVDRE